MNKKTKVVAVPTAPDHLTDEAKAEWLALAPILAARGHVDAGSLVALEQLVSQLAVVRECEMTIKREGFMVAGVRGGSRPHPCVGAKNRAVQVAFQLQRRLGLLPDVEPGLAPVAGDAYSELGID